MIKKFLGKKNQSASVHDGMEAKQKRYEAIVQALHRDIYRYAYWLCHDQHIAEDLVQETFMRAWRALDSLKDEGAAKAWLITILRRENARRFERKQFNVVDIDDQPVADESSVSIEQNFENAQLRRHIQALSPEYREPLLLQVIGGFSGHEIASILELNKNTVMTRLFRARNQLKEALEQPLRGQNNG